MGLPGNQWETLPRVKQFVLTSDVGQSSIFSDVKRKRTSCVVWFPSDWNFLFKRLVLGNGGDTIHAFGNHCKEETWSYCNYKAVP